jgi:hypothetical protein
MMREDGDQPYRRFARQNAVLSMMVDALGKSRGRVTADACYRLRERMTENQCRIYELKGIVGLVMGARPGD